MFTKGSEEQNWQEEDSPSPMAAEEAFIDTSMDGVEAEEEEEELQAPTAEKIGFVERGGNLPTEESRRPSGMVGLEEEGEISSPSPTSPTSPTSSSQPNSSRVGQEESAKFLGTTTSLMNKSDSPTPGVVAIDGEDDNSTPTSGASTSPHRSSPFPFPTEEKLQEEEIEEDGASTVLEEGKKPNPKRGGSNAGLSDETAADLDSRPTTTTSSPPDSSSSPGREGDQPINTTNKIRMDSEGVPTTPGAAALDGEEGEDENEGKKKSIPTTFSSPWHHRTTTTTTTRTPFSQRKRRNPDEDDEFQIFQASYAAAATAAAATTTPGTAIANVLESTLHLETPTKRYRSCSGAIPAPSAPSLPQNERDSVKEEKNENEEESSNTSKNNSDVEVMSLASAESFNFDDSDDDDEENIEDSTADTSANVDMTRPFDMSLLKHCIETGSDALEQVNGKHVIIVVGKTGVGKSSLMQGIAGKTFKPIFHYVTHKGQNVAHKVFDVVEDEDPIPGFEIGHDKCSKTKSIRSLERKVTENSETILYLDTPGFEDTDGPEMDIATSVMLNKVAKSCKTLRFCILIHYASLKEDRGGAIRSILKFTRNFVKDFEKERQSFVFLFTHTNEFMLAPHEPYTLDLAKKNLRDEIVKILKETNDEDVKVVLDHMRICLKKKLPFVDVLHPLKTDFVQLRNTLETKTRTVKNPTLATNCGLTSSSGFKLEGEVQNLMSQVRHLISGSSQQPQNTKAINDIREMLQYLGNFIEIPKVREAVLSCEETVNRHCTELQTLINNEIQRGTDLTSAFGIQNARDLSVAVRQLLDLNTTLQETHFSGRLEREVGEYYQQSLLEGAPSEDYRIVALQLDKLRAWKETFSTFDSLYGTARNRYEGEILSYTEKVRDLDASAIETATNQERDILFRSLTILKSVCANTESLLGHHGLPTAAAVEVFASSKHKISSVITSWKQDEADMMDLDEIGDTALISLASRARCLDILRSKFDESAICPDLVRLIKSTSSELEAGIVENFQNSASELVKLPLPFPNYGVQKLHNLKEACNLFDGIRGQRWKEIQLYFLNVISNIKSLLSVKASELDKTADHVRRHGIVDGKSEGILLSSFDACIKFDMYFDTADRFVENCCTKYWNTYDTRIDQVLADVNKSFDSLLRDTSPPDSIQLKEVHQIIEFLAAASLTDRQEHVESVVRDRIEQYTTYLSKRKTAALNEWAAATRNLDAKEIARLTGEMDAILGKIIGLQQLDPTNREPFRMQSDITEALGRAFKARVEATNSNTNADYKELSNLLNCVEACGAWPRTKAHLPVLSTLKESVVCIVSAHAQRIEGMVESSSDWDSIDLELESFKQARQVDGFVGGQATSRLGPLLKLREQKESDVDDLLHDLITNEDFKGIGNFLRPLADSNDQMKRQKFDRFRQQISSSLKEKIESAERYLATTLSSEEAVMISETLTKLEVAQKEIGRNLKIYLDLTKETTKLKRRVNDEFLDVLDQLLAANEKADFVRIANLKFRVEIFQDHLHGRLSNKTQKHFRQVMTSCKKTVDNITILVDKFITTNFVDGDELIGSLSSLKGCLEDSASSQFTNLYHQTVKDITEKTNESLRRLDNFTCESGCFDIGIEVLSALVRQLERGLKNHINEDTFVFNCQEKVDSWQLQLESQEQAMVFGADNANEKLEAWCARLDKLKSPGLIRRIGGFFGESTQSTYEKERGKLVRQVQDVIDNSKAALHSRDFYLLQECVIILECVAQKVPKHLKGASKDSNNLKQQIIRAFLDHTTQMKEMLEEKKLSQLESKFLDFKGFLLQIPHLRRNRDVMKSFALVNQLVFEVLYKQIEQVMTLTSFETDSFDFLAIKSSVEQARSFGSFVADNFVLLHEELQTLEINEKWLNDISALCQEHFQEGRDFKLLKYCVLLDVVPSASQQDIKRAYRTKAKSVHPDKRKSRANDMDVDEGAEFRKVKEAHDVLLTAAEARELRHGRAFDGVLRKLGTLLRNKAREFLAEQRYDSTKELLFRLPTLAELDNLVSPPLHSEKTRREVNEVVGNHVKKAKTEVSSFWSERNYRQLNDCITDLKQMETHFKSFSDVFPTSWNTGILGEIETRIDELRRKALEFLSDKKTAKRREDEFRRCFLEMGSVLVELPAMKDYTKQSMCEVLEASLKYEWGFSYLFELGLGLQRGDGDQTEDEARVAHILLAEFSHFKEVMTMAWNTETTQKPVEDTVNGISGQDLLTRRSILMDTEALLQSFESFEVNYKKLLGEYIKPDSDLVELVEKTKAASQSLGKISCEGGWTEDVTGKVPLLLAGVFAYFTVTKSGESFNRIEGSEEASNLGDKLLFKPHNIQVLTILNMLGCGKPSRNNNPNNDLESQLRQIRTGEGKSMILGACATVFGLLGFTCRVVCYSDYLSARDFRLFEDVFRAFDLCELVKYSKITAFSEDATAAKGDIRGLTVQLLSQNVTSAAAASTRESITGSEGSSTANRGCVARRTRSSGNGSGGASVTRPQSQMPPQGPTSQHQSSDKVREEILLLDEVDVFFGADFYGQTYNQVAQIREPEVADILKVIWAAHKRGGRRLRLADIKKITPYKRLVQKLSGFEYMLDNEISLMLDQVKRVDDEPYYLSNDRIGYKVMDSVDFNVTYGYRTVFAYLKESDRGALQNNSTLEKMLCMPVSCGQFSYARINPTRILGVSGTLEAMGDYERKVLAKYGIRKFVFMPSVYGKSNFNFDKAGGGIFIEEGKSDFFQGLSTEIRKVTKQKRAVIVFFRDATGLKEFEESAFYRKLGRQKAKLSEDMDADEKDYVIKKAATAGQVTISTAVFGRGTDFFCKDQKVLDGGGVHIIQTFLSAEESEEIQIQGRTARQGKVGTYQLVLLDSDLTEFGLTIREKEHIPKSDWYKWLCQARKNRYAEHWKQLEESLAEATVKDTKTHQYFDALLQSNPSKAAALLKDIYMTMKKRPNPSNIEIDLAVLVDVTGSMAPYSQAVLRTIKSLSLKSRLQATYPDIEFKFRISVLAYKDIDDSDQQFQESSFRGCHFSENENDALRFLENVTASPSGGFDLAEDHLGAIDKCIKWNDWASPLKFIMVFTDAPQHGCVPSSSQQIPNVDSYDVRPDRAMEEVVDGLFSKEADLFFLSFNPTATAPTEERLGAIYLNHPDNTEERELTTIPMVPKQDGRQRGIVKLSGRYGQHIVFVLDQSGSMSRRWSGVVAAYRDYLHRRMQNQSQSDLVSVIQFNNLSKVTVQCQPIGSAPKDLRYTNGGTFYSPAANDAYKVALSSPASHAPVVVFMSDGLTSEQDASYAADVFASLNQQVRNQRGHDLELHVIAFGAGLDTRQLQSIAGASPKGQLYTSADTAELSNIFVDIASSSQDVGKILEAEVGRRITDAVSDKLSMEYLG